MQAITDIMVSTGSLRDATGEEEDDDDDDVVDDDNNVEGDDGDVD